MGVPVVLHEMRPDGRHAGAPDRRAGRARLLQLLPLRRRHRQRRRPAALGDARRRRPDHRHRRPARAARGRRARRRPRAVQPSGHRRGCGAPADQHRTRRDHRAARRLVERHRRHRPADLAGARRDDPRADRRAGARLLRRHRPDRALRQHRSLEGLVPVALRQGRDRGRAHRLPELPDGPRPLRVVHRRAARRRHGGVQGLGARHPLLRGLPADRGDGRARPRDPALRPDEAGGPDQPARPRRPSPTRWCSSAATTRSAPSTTSSASRPSSSTPPRSRRSA